MPFSNILESVKDDTGMTNLRNLLPRIRRLVYRVEKDIGYGGSVLLRKVVYKTSDNTILYDGYQYKLKLPNDVVHLEAIGICKENNICPGDYKVQGNWIFFGKKIKLTSFTLLYYTLLTDGEGNPVTTENHLEAVVSGICMYLYRAKRFVDKGSRATYKDLEEYYHDRISEARGDDFWPSTEAEWSKASSIMQMSSRDILIYSEEEQCFTEIPESILTSETINGSCDGPIGDDTQDPANPSGGGSGDGGGGGDIDIEYPVATLNVADQFVEKGTLLNQTISIGFEPNDAGAVLSYSLEKDQVEISTNQNTLIENLIMLNEFIMQGKVAYEAGTQILGGTAETETAKFTPVVPQWKGQKNNNVSLNNSTYANFNSVLSKFIDQESKASITVSAGNYGFFISNNPNASIRENNLGFKLSPNAFEKRTITAKLANDEDVTLTEYIIRPSQAEFTYNLE